MRKLTKIILIIIILLIIIASIFYFSKTLTGKAIEDHYTHTKAICNETNFCQDYEIVCEGNKTISTKPITGAFVQYSEDWKDPRDLDSKKLCG